MTQFHEKKWRELAAKLHLNLKLIPGTSGTEYAYASTRIARHVWEERSILAGKDADIKAAHNSALQKASEVVYELHGADTAKAIQALMR